MKHGRGRRGSGGARRGAAMVAAVVVIVVLVGMAGTVMTLSVASQHEHRASEETLKAQYLAEAGISDKISQMIAGNLGNLGADKNRSSFSGGDYWVQVDTLDPVQRIYRLTSRGSYESDAEGIEAVVQPVTTPVGRNAIFAGNGSGSPTYELPLGGTGASADRINGDVYSGGDIEVTGNAVVTGTIRAKGAITGANGYSGVKQPAPDFAGANYPVNHNYNVNNLFSSATYKDVPALGGQAWQMPSTSPVHIFRKNPADRTTETNSTTGDDYFLEDPYEAVNDDSPSGNGSDATMISLPGSSANGKVFFIKGNLWIHNKKTLSFKIKPTGGQATRMTIAVQGNIYIGDSIFYSDKNKDGLALIAIKDPARPDSGSMYFGDPKFGTLRTMEGFMYAENDFYDNNLDQAGSRVVTVNGNIVAGDQVLINRDYGPAHTKMTVNYDGRLVTGTLNMPGIPAQAPIVTGYSVLAWRQVAAD